MTDNDRTDEVDTALIATATAAQRRLIDFAYDVVSGRFTDDEIRAVYHLTKEEYTALVERDDVAAEMHKMRRMLDDHGAMIRYRIAQQAHRQIDVLTKMSEDTEVPTNTRAKCAIALLEFGDVRKKTESDAPPLVVPIQIVTPMQVDLPRLDPFKIELHEPDYGDDLL